MPTTSSNVMTDPAILKYLATQAVQHLLAQTNMVVTHASGWQRPTNWPLPVKRAQPDADGSTSQAYRPLAILEYVHDTLSRRPEGDPQ